jgi:hypothetical protein
MKTTIRLLTPTAIARLLGRTPKSVIEAIHRLDIKAKAETPSSKLYPPETVDEVRAGMRRANGTQD